jgi:hypothetical protein
VKSKEAADQLPLEQLERGLRILTDVLFEKCMQPISALREADCLHKPGHGTENTIRRAFPTVPASLVVQAHL